jgi:hypothetical protein
LPKLSPIWKPRPKIDPEIARISFQSGVKALRIHPRMKPFLFIFGILVAGILGYSNEPKLRSALTHAPKPKASAVQSEEALMIDLGSLAPNQLPEKVMLTQDIQFAQKSSGLTLFVGKGTEVLLVRVNGTNLAVRPIDTTYLIEVSVKHTDLIDRLRSQPLPLPLHTETAPATTPETVPAPEPGQAPETTPATEPEPAPAPEPTPAPAPEPAPVAEPEPAPAPAPEPPATPTTTDAPPAVPTNIVVIMQESIRDGQIKEFKFEQVLGWKAGENETVDGQTFQTGLVSYKAETIFGVKTIQAKALIQNGKVVRWIWPKSGMEIK